MAWHDEESGPQAARSQRLRSQIARVCPPVVHTPPTAAPWSSAELRGVGTTKEEAASESKNAVQRSSEVAQRVMASVAQTGCGVSSACSLQIAQLGEEKEFLTRYVERLLTQLRQVLHKHGELDRLTVLSDPLRGQDMGKDLSRDEDVAEKSPPWITAREFMNPLLQAYELKISDLEHAVDENKKATDRITARAESLVKENDMLRQELEATAEKLVLRMQHEPNAKTPYMGNDDLLCSHEYGEYLGEVNERIEVLMSENNMLMEQVSLQDDEVGGLKKEIADRDQQLSGMSQNFNHATIALQELRDSCDVLRDDKTRCEHQLQQYAAKLAQLESQKESLAAQVEELRAEVKHGETQLVEYEEVLENVKRNAEVKDEMVSVKYQNVCSRLRDLNRVVEAREKRTDELEEMHRLAVAELESVRQDCEGMLDVMNNMEKQLSQYSAREDAVAELELECKAKVEDMTIEMEQVAAREVQARREIARLLERIRIQTEEHLREDEQRVNDAKRKIENDLSCREEEIRTKSTEVAQLRVKMEISARNQREAEKNLADSLRRTKQATDMFDRKLKQLSERAAAAEEARDLITASENDAVQSLRAKEEELAAMRNEARDRATGSNERIVSLERELEVRRAEARELKEETEEKNLKIQLLNEQLIKVKADCANRFSSDFESVHTENRELKTRASELEYRLEQMKKEVANIVETGRNERERVEARLLAEIESLKGRLVAIKEEKGRVERARQEAESKHSVLSLQLHQLGRDLADTKEALHDREHVCDDSDRKISELSAQLTISLSKQQQFYRQERELKATMERSALEKTRLERDVMVARKKLEGYRQAEFLSPSHGYSARERSSFLVADKHTRGADSTRNDAVYQLPT